MDDFPEIREIGSNLIAYSHEVETSARGVVTDLFPYIFTASKRMSTRAISAYLEEHHQVKISAATIGRALRAPEKHLEAFADRIEPQARIVAGALDQSICDLLSDPMYWKHSTDPERSRPSLDADNLEGEYREYTSAIDFINSEWFGHCSDLRARTFKYIQDADGDAAQRLKNPPLLEKP